MVSPQDMAVTISMITLKKKLDAITKELLVCKDEHRQQLLRAQMENIRQRMAFLQYGFLIDAY